MVGERCGGCGDPLASEAGGRRCVCLVPSPPETGPAAYRRNLPSMAPGAGPSGGPGDATATGPKPKPWQRMDRRRPAWAQDPRRPLAENVGRF